MYVIEKLLACVAASNPAALYDSKLRAGEGQPRRTTSRSPISLPVAMLRGVPRGVGRSCSHVQQADCGASGRRQTADVPALNREVIVPSISTRVEQCHNSACVGIDAR
jgi:hypothetical protein